LGTAIREALCLKRLTERGESSKPPKFAAFFFGTGNFFRSSNPTSPVQDLFSKRPVRRYRVRLAAQVNLRPRFSLMDPATGDDGQ